MDEPAEYWNKIEGALREYGYVRITRWERIKWRVNRLLRRDQASRIDKAIGDMELWKGFEVVSYYELDDDTNPWTTPRT